MNNAYLLFESEINTTGDPPIEQINNSSFESYDPTTEQINNDDNDVELGSKTALEYNKNTNNTYEAASDNNFNSTISILISNELYLSYFRFTFYSIYMNTLIILICTLLIYFSFTLIILFY